MRGKKVLIGFISFIILISSLSFAQSKKEIEEREREKYIEKNLGIMDRAGGVHNASNIGLFFGNRG
jgi:hypothetical protein